jgi:hypothetical protein
MSQVQNFLGQRVTKSEYLGSDYHLDLAGDEFNIQVLCLKLVTYLSPGLSSSG